MTSQSGARRCARDSRSPLSPSVSRASRDAPNGFALEVLSICSAGKLSSDGEGEPSPSSATREH